MRIEPLHPTVTKINPAVEQNIVETLAEVKRVMDKFQTTAATQPPPTIKKKSNGTVIITLILVNAIGVCGLLATQAIANHNTSSLTIKK